MKRVLVAYTSRHGSTGDLADAIGASLTDAGLGVAVRKMGEVVSVDAYDALVLGSAVYMDNWLPEAQAFVRQNLEHIVVRPTWLFSSGPIGSVPAVPFDGSSLLAQTSAREHRLFGGRLERGGLSVSERFVVRLLRVPARDDRDWAAVAYWAAAIADSLVEVPA